MGSLFAAFTVRGRAFLAAGAATGAIGVVTGQPTLQSVGGLLVVLPLLSAAAAGRARRHLSCAREISPTRVPAGHAAAVSVQLSNSSKVPTGLLLAEDAVGFPVAVRPRFVMDRVEAGGSRRFSYPVTPDQRGRYSVGPLAIRVADTFGLVRVDMVLPPAAALTVTPAVVPLSKVDLAGSWLGDGGHQARSSAAAGEDDVVPRTYRDGDDLRRVHWRSTARHGELMVRREEQRWRNRATLFLDTRQGSHSGRGASSSFEYAVTAVASIGVYLAGEGGGGELVTDQGAVTGAGEFEDVLLDALAVIRQSRNTAMTPGASRVARGERGLVVAVVGRLTPAEARHLAAARGTGRRAIAVVLATATWADQRLSAEAEAATKATADILTAAGWRVVILTAGMALDPAWKALSQPAVTGDAASANGHSPGRAVPTVGTPL